ncbi:MAG: 2-oxoglutarate dehydrogenase E1 component [Terriglobales bacterium]
MSIVKEFPQVETAVPFDEREEPILDSFRRWGYFEAKLDPLEQELKPLAHPELRVSGPAAERARQVYCGAIGVEFMHIPDPEKRRWIQERIEAKPPDADQQRILERLVQADVFEQVLQARYLGTKRFSLEGVTALVPLLDEILQGAIDKGAIQVVLGMSHRGRLNVIAQIVQRSAAEIFAGFEDVDPRSVLGGGDVKYHLGSTGTYTAPDGRTVRVHLVSNPSHLEAVDPVVLGRTRAKQIRLAPFSACQVERTAEDAARERILPVVMHGDAAFAGQGILAETLNLSTLSGFEVGGTIHIVVNNLLGFTATPRETHASRYASDVAKRLPVPIFHVNAEEPEAVTRVGRLALEYRYTFGSDVVVDLIGYRRHGHSEIDDPSITQPVLYRKIKDHPPLWEIYAKRIHADAEPIVACVRAVYEEALQKAKKLEKRPQLYELPQYWSAYTGGPYKPEYEVDTGVAAGELRKIAEGLTRYPDGFHAHPKIKKLLEQRLAMGSGKQPLDYGMAEALAFGSLVLGGAPVRLSGQDSKRGTFNQRHAVLIDTENEREWIPLCHLSPDQARFEVYNSELSEAAVMGFEYGYSRDYPESLVLWEAQFGDFANGGQIIIDQFITAAEDKWGLLSGLVLLLPHGYEGQGPEHSSARVERYLQLAANDNIQICQPSNAAQYFHLLRRQVLRRWRKPLVVFTPKSMLRHPDALSPIADFSRPRFLPIINDTEVQNAERVLVCTGKVGHELRMERKRRKDNRTAIVFLEQLYPFPEAELNEALRKHPGAREVVWVQEEPANMGALGFVLPRLRRASRPLPVRSVKRSATASPATGSAKAHELEQKALLSLAFAKTR